MLLFPLRISAGYVNVIGYNMSGMRGTVRYIETCCGIAIGTGLYACIRRSSACETLYYTVGSCFVKWVVFIVDSGSSKRAPQMV